MSNYTVGIVWSKDNTNSVITHFAVTLCMLMYLLIDRLLFSPALNTLYRGHTHGGDLAERALRAHLGASPGPL